MECNMQSILYFPSQQASEDYIIPGFPDIPAKERLLSQPPLVCKILMKYLMSISLFQKLCQAFLLEIPDFKPRSFVVPVISVTTATSPCYAKTVNLDS